jgi:hypothetical protein
MILYGKLSVSDYVFLQSNGVIKGLQLSVQLMNLCSHNDKVSITVSAYRRNSLISAEEDRTNISPTDVRTKSVRLAAKAFHTEYEESFSWVPLSRTEVFIH